MALNINGTTGISGVDGSASAASIAGTDANTGLSFASDTVNINTGGSTRATVDSSGNLGVGETTPLGKLHVKSADSGASVASYADELVVEGSTDSGLTILSGNTKDGSLAFGDDGNNVAGRVVYSHPNNSMQFFTDASERIRIDSSGRVGIGTSTTNNPDVGDGGLQIRPNHTNGAPDVHFTRASSSNTTSTCVGFVNGNVGVGSITYKNAGTDFNTSSDYRLKENVTAISDGITRLKTLKPSRFNFIDDETDTLRDGFLAHEVTAVPEAVTGTKDEVDSENNPVYQGINQSRLVPLLTAALQEAIAKIETLETKVAALEAG